MAGKSTCGNIIPSSCVPFTGKDLKFLSIDNQLACDASMDDVVDKVSIAIDSIQQAIDVTTYNISCLTSTLPKTVKSVLQDQANKICALNASLTALQAQLASLNIANELITIDLGCLASSAAPCQVNTNTYTLISVLTLFKNEICAIKSNLGI